MAERQIEIPVHDNPVLTTRSLDPNHPNNVQLLVEKEHEKKYKELLDEVKVRFDTNPRFYQKEDYKKLIELLDESGAASIKEEDLRTIGGESLVGEGDVDFKTINGEIITGEGNIEIIDQVLTAGNALKIEDIEDSDEKLISVTSHIYDEESDNCKFGSDNIIEGKHSVAFGSDNEISDQSKNPIEFIGYCKAPNSSTDEYFYIDDEDYTLVPHGTDVDDREFHYKLLGESSEDAGTRVDDIPDLVGSTLYADSEGTMPLGIVSKSMYAYGMHYGEYTAIIYFSLEQYPTDIPRSFISVWRQIPADRSENSIVHGFSNLVCADNAHAEGKDTEALENQAHSEGEFTVAQGINSHSEGQYTTAFGTASHAEGEGGSISLFRNQDEEWDEEKSFIIIKTSPLESDSDSAAGFFYGSDFFSDSDEDLYAIEKENKLAGWVGRPLYRANGELLAIITKIENTRIFTDRPVRLRQDEPIYIKTSATGEDSHVEGLLTDASGAHSHAEGERTLATGTNAHSEGYHTKAFGANSHAEGEHTEALAFGAHAEGYQTHTEGEYSHTEGYDTKASGTYAHGEGKSSSAGGSWSHAEGEDSQASGIGAHAEGTRCNAQGAYSHAEGYNTSTEGNFENVPSSDHSEKWQVAAHAEGKDTQAAQTASHSEGINTRADGDAAHAEGVDSKAFGIGSHAEGINTFTNEHSEGSHTEGYETQTNANYSHAEGWKTVAQNHNDDGYGAHAEGGETLTEGTFAHAEGEHTRALNRGAHAEGYKTDATNKYEHAEGKRNVSNNTHINTSVEYVDLGLPSGTLWATCNIGATDFDAYGDYYAWGETETKDTYTNNNCKWWDEDCGGTIKYCTDLDYWCGDTPAPDRLTRLVLDDDVAAKTLGKNWRIPSQKDFEELLENTNHYWTDEYDGGYIFESKSDSSVYIFLPAAGEKTNAVINAGSECCYWTSDVDVNSDCGGFCLMFYDDGYDFVDMSRYVGLSIRPVSSKLQTLHSVGVGESDADHRNALEITTDGSIFVKGVGDYDGTNPQSAKSLQQLLLNVGNGESGLSPETAIVIAAALNDLNDRINELLESSAS